MRFLTDENVSPSSVDLLKKLGHDVLDVKESRKFGKEDTEIFELAKSQKRILFTLDTHFKDKDQFSPPQCGGVIVSEISPNTPKRVNPRLKALLISTKPDKIKNNLVVLKEKKWDFLVK